MGKRAAYVRGFETGSEAKINRRDAQRAILAIWDSHSNRLRSDFDDEEFAPTKNESAKNFLRRELYALGIQLLKAPPTSWSVADLVNRVRVNRTTRPELLPNTFHDLFMCVYEEDSPISRQERWLMARELEYAYRHNVPPELLCGFLYQSGPRTEIARKLKDDYIEPAFRPQPPDG